MSENDHRSGESWTFWGIKVLCTPSLLLDGSKLMVRSRFTNRIRLNASNSVTLQRFQRQFYSCGSDDVNSWENEILDATVQSSAVNNIMTTWFAKCLTG